MPTPQRTEHSAQDWMPVADIEGRIVTRKDGHLVGLLRLHPLNTDLLHEREIARIARSIAEAWNGERDGFQLFSIGRSIDLGSYKAELQTLAENAVDPRRRAVLRMFLHETLRVMAGDVVERQHYMILSQAPDKDAKADLLHRLDGMTSRLSLAGVRADAVNERDIVRLYALFASPVMSTLSGDVQVNHFDMPLYGGVDPV